MDKLKNLVSVLAPTLGTALGGPLGGAAVAILAEALGLEKNAEPADVAAAARSADPEVLKASMARAEASFKAAAEEAITLREQITASVQMVQMDYAQGFFHSLWRPAAGWIAVAYAGGFCLLAMLQAWQGNYQLLSMAPSVLMIGGPIMALAGIYTWQRSNEKIAMANNAPPNIIDAVKGMLTKR